MRMHDISFDGKNSMITQHVDSKVSTPVNVNNHPWEYPDFLMDAEDNESCSVLIESVVVTPTKIAKK